MPDLVRKGREDLLSLEGALNLLLELGVQRKNIRIYAEGGFHRFRGGILRHEPNPGVPIGPETEITLYVTEEGLYDTLPDGIFSSSGVLDKRQEEVEKEIRNFLATFDSLFFQSSSFLEYQKGVTHLIYHDETLTKSFLQYFGFPGEGWEKEDLIIWRTLLPSAPAWIGSKTGIERIVKAFFGVECLLEENIPHRNEIPPGIQNRMGEQSSTLGQDCMVGDHFFENDSAILLRFGPLRMEDLPNFCPGGKERKRLERILSFSSPGNVTCEIQLVLEGEDQKFIPGEGAGYNLLGYSTYLGQKRGEDR